MRHPSAVLLSSSCPAPVSMSALLAPSPQHALPKAGARSPSVRMPSNGVRAAAAPHKTSVRPGALLPDELLVQVFEAVASISRRDLCSVSRVSKPWHEVADAVLYKRVRFQDPEHHLRFSDSLGRRIRRGSAIQDVSLEYPTSELSHLHLDGHIHGSHYEPSRYEALSRTISTMSNLEVLEVSVPVNLLHGIGALFNGPFDLACLKSCTLFYQCAGDAYWDLRENIHIFAHPTLETLVIRRAKLDYRGFDFIERPHQTALKKLHLVECDVSDDALGDVLEFPEALEEFVLTQLEEPSPEVEESSDNIGDYIIALRPQCHTIETITIDFPALTGRKPLRMRDFTKLKTLRINWDYQLFGKSSKKPRLHSVGIPPVLETLEFFHELGTDAEVTDLLEYTLQVNETTHGNLKTMVVIEGDSGVPREIIQACKSGNVKLKILGASDVDDEADQPDQPEGKEQN